LDDLHGAQVLRHPNGGALRSQKVAFVIKQDAEEMLQSLREYYLQNLLQKHADSLTPSILSELFWNDDRHIVESEKLLAMQEKQAPVEAQDKEDVKEEQKKEVKTEFSISDDDIEEGLEDLGLAWEEETISNENLSDLESNTGFVKGTIGNAVIRAGNKKQESGLSKEKEAKDTPKQPVLGKAVISLPENYDPYRQKQHTTSKTERKTTSANVYTNNDGIEQREVSEPPSNKEEGKVPNTSKKISSKESSDEKAKVELDTETVTNTEVEESKLKDTKTKPKSTRGRKKKTEGSDVTSKPASTKTTTKTTRKKSTTKKSSTKKSTATKKKTTAKRAPAKKTTTKKTSVKKKTTDEESDVQVKNEKIDSPSET
jgi:hypothetical protein